MISVALYNKELALSCSCRKKTFSLCLNTKSVSLRAHRSASVCFVLRNMFFASAV